MDTSDPGSNSDPPPPPQHHHLEPDEGSAGDSASWYYDLDDIQEDDGDGDYDSDYQDEPDEDEDEDDDFQGSVMSIMPRLARKPIANSSLRRCITRRCRV